MVKFRDIPGEPVPQYNTLPNDAARAEVESRYRARVARRTRDQPFVEPLIDALDSAGVVFCDVGDLTASWAARRPADLGPAIAVLRRAVGSAYGRAGRRLAVACLDNPTARPLDPDVLDVLVQHGPRRDAAVPDEPDFGDGSLSEDDAFSIADNLSRHGHAANDLERTLGIIDDPAQYDSVRALLLADLVKRPRARKHPGVRAAVQRYVHDSSMPLINAALSGYLRYKEAPDRETLGRLLKHEEAEVRSKARKLVALSMGGSYR